MIQIDDTLHLSRMLLNHYLFCICECQLRGCNIALDPNIGRCLERSQSLTHSSLLLHDILVRDNHNRLTGLGKNLSQLGFEKLLRLSKF